MGFYDAIDLLWDENGDYIVGEDGDIASTEDDLLVAFLQQVRTLLIAEVADWESDPMFSTGLKDFVGEPNTSETGRDIEDRIISSLIYNEIANADDLYVRVVPVKPDAVLAVVSVAVTPTAGNQLEKEGEVKVAFLLNIEEGRMIFIEAEKAVNLFPVGA